MKRVAIWLAVLCGAALIVLFCLYNPATAPFPRCPFYVTTGFLCPGCGSQRAIYQLLHGHLGAAFGYNGFMVASLPYVGALFVLMAAPKNRFTRLRRWCYNPTVVWIYMALVFAWWIGRNIWGWV